MKMTKEQAMKAVKEAKEVYGPVLFGDGSDPFYIRLMKGSALDQMARLPEAAMIFVVINPNGCVYIN